MAENTSQELFHLSSETIESTKRSFEDDCELTSATSTNKKDENLYETHTKLPSEGTFELEESKKKLRLNQSEKSTNYNCPSDEPMSTIITTNSIPVDPLPVVSSTCPSSISNVQSTCTNVNATTSTLPPEYHSFLTSYVSELEKQATIDTSKDTTDIFANYKPHAYAEVVFRRRRNNNLAEKFAQIYGTSSKSHQLKLSDVQPEVFDWTFQHLEKK